MTNAIDAIYKSIGMKIVNARKRKAISQEQLATLSGIDRSHIGFIEQGRRRPTIGTVSKLARALDIKLEDIFRGL